LLLLVGLWSARLTYGVVRWKTYIWLPSYICSSNPDIEIPDDQKHLIFVMVDHYEPGRGERGAEKNRAWLERFRPIADGHRDSYGNTFRYTWFYPYDHKNEAVLVDLCKIVHEGYGEVELHWHHPVATSETFPQMLEEAIAWFQQYGAMISSGAEPSTHFAFIHGNWALDNSQPGCGVDNELDILFHHGCYADFTFSTIGTVSQPKKVNSIYYATDTPAPKSYDDGIDAQVGQPIDDRLMIFQGPIHFDLITGAVEYSAVESDPDLFPSPARINSWIEADVHVKGRPEWVFVKVYSHGAQSADQVLEKYLNLMLGWIEEICCQRGISLHYMTAREAYNVAKAAEDGRTGNPEQYRDYRIPKPCNMLFHTEVPVRIEHITEQEAVYSSLPADKVTGSQSGDHGA
jgi:hypothetical protein